MRLWFAAACISLTLLPIPVQGQPEEDRHGHEAEQNPYEAGPQPKVQPGPLRPRVVAKDGMVHIAGGTYYMGPADRKAKPRGPIHVPPYWLDRTEVTVAAYRACVERGECERPSKTSTRCTFDQGDNELPVSCVRWRDADTYCRKASKRLPAESEWEFAARGVTGAQYPWGGGIGQCRYAATLMGDRHFGKPCTKGPVRVGTYASGASSFGALDLSGNVEEWVSDWFTEKPGVVPPSSGASHVLRGGSWLSPPSWAKSTSRSYGSAMEAGPTVGFRCARDDH